ncbi:SCO family protein [Pedobacter sp. SD-b]|uniref:SCO family protein n=1 Tax=Pedobacter segetis TaxID=2793069 RepID=A0ABS1BHI4_9SPHI|nr:SCO family protein [Pedobacter segetis]MBK0382338.1 SCO family protein [Pedobacter segetis]
MYRTVFLRISFFCFLFSLLACADNDKTERLPYYNSPDFTPIFLKTDDEANRKITHQIANFSCIDQHGNIITQKDIIGKVHVASFIFTSCGSICPIITKNMKLLQNEFKNDKNVVMLSYSVTPWIDDVERLKVYAQVNKINAANWHLLTGKKYDIYKLARQSYFAEEDLGFTKDSTQFLHTEHILLVDKNRKIRGIYNGTLELEADQLIKDIKTLEKE